MNLERGEDNPAESTSTITPSSREHSLFYSSSNNSIPQHLQGIATTTSHSSPFASNVPYGIQSQASSSRGLPPASVSASLERHVTRNSVLFSDLVRHSNLFEDSSSNEFPEDASTEHQQSSSTGVPLFHLDSGSSNDVSYPKLLNKHLFVPVDDNVHSKNLHNTPRKDETFPRKGIKLGESSTAVSYSSEEMPTFHSSSTSRSNEVFSSTSGNSLSTLSADKGSTVYSRSQKTDISSGRQSSINNFGGSSVSHSSDFISQPGCSRRITHINTSDPKSAPGMFGNSIVIHRKQKNVSKNSSRGDDPAPSSSAISRLESVRTNQNLFAVHNKSVNPLRAEVPLSASNEASPSNSNIATREVIDSHVGSSLAGPSFSNEDDCLVSSSTELVFVEASAETSNSGSRTEANDVPILDSTVDSTGDPLSCLDSPANIYENSLSDTDISNDNQSRFGSQTTSKEEDDEALQYVSLASFRLQSLDSESSNDGVDLSEPKYTSSQYYPKGSSAVNKPGNSSRDSLAGSAFRSLRGNDPFEACEDDENSNDSIGADCGGALQSSFELGFSTRDDSVSRSTPLLPPAQILEDRLQVFSNDNWINRDKFTPCQSSLPADSGDNLTFTIPVSSSQVSSFTVCASSAASSPHGCSQPLSVASSAVEVSRTSGFAMTTPVTAHHSAVCDEPSVLSGTDFIPNLDYEITGLVSSHRPSNSNSSFKCEDASGSENVMRQMQPLNFSATVGADPNLDCNNGTNTSSSSSISSQTLQNIGSLNASFSSNNSLLTHALDIFQSDASYQNTEDVEASSVGHSVSNSTSSITNASETFTNSSSASQVGFRDEQECTLRKNIDTQYINQPSCSFSTYNSSGNSNMPLHSSSISTFVLGTESSHAQLLPGSGSKSNVFGNFSASAGGNNPIGTDSASTSGISTPNSASLETLNDQQMKRKSANLEDIPQDAITPHRSTRVSKKKSSTHAAPDEILSCKDCMENIDSGFCPRHSVTVIADKTVMDRAWASVPSSYLCIRSLSQHLSEYGVFAKRNLGSRVFFGPLVAPLCNEKPDLPLVYSVTNDGNSFSYFDTSQLDHCNWMSLVKPAQNYLEQNCLIVERQPGSIYFLTIVAILAGTQLKVGYSSQYASKRNLPTITPSPQEQKQLEEENTWPCFGCDQRFPSSSELIEHLSTHDETSESKKQVKRKVRGKRKPRSSTSAKSPAVDPRPSSSQASYRKEEKLTRQKKDEVTLKCLICKKMFGNSKILLMHQLQHSSVMSSLQQRILSSLQCPQCFEYCLNSKEFLSHIESHSNLPAGRTQNGSTGSSSTFKRARFVCEDPPRENNCPICRKTFPGLQEMKNHFPEHVVDGFFSCPRCDKKFDTYRKVRRHIRAYCSEVLKCEECGKEFPSSAKLKRHMLVHTMAKEFSCGVCGRQFNRKDKLKEHFDRMHGPCSKNKILKTRATNPAFLEKTKVAYRSPYKCNLCLLGFKRRGMLVNHVLKCHPGVDMSSIPDLKKPLPTSDLEYPCLYCSKTYLSNTTRNNHIFRVHPGQDKASAEQVRRMDPKLAVLHSADRSPKLPHKCSYCSREYITQAKLNQHHKRYHPEHFEGADEESQDCSGRAHQTKGINVDGVKLSGSAYRQCIIIDSGEGQSASILQQHEATKDSSRVERRFGADSGPMVVGRTGSSSSLYGKSQLVTSVITNMDSLPPNSLVRHDKIITTSPVIDGNPKVIMAEVKGNVNPVVGNNPVGEVVVDGSGVECVCISPGQLLVLNSAAGQSVDPNSSEPVSVTLFGGENGDTFTLVPHGHIFQVAKS